MFERVVRFIRKEFREPKAVIPIHAPVFRGNEKKYLSECIESTFVSSVGSFVDRLEEMTTAYTGATRAVASVNGTSALAMALTLCGVRSGDEVVTQALTFVATANAIRHVGARPVFLDVDRSSMGLSPERLSDWLDANAEKTADGCVNRKSGGRIRACVPMHAFGHPARVDILRGICDDWGIRLVEDAAEGLGSRRRGRHVGVIGDVGVLSFNGNKIITTGGGGMMLFQDALLGEKAKHLTTQAKMPHRWEFVHDAVGYNHRMPNLNAALGCAQMEQLDGFLEDKRSLAEAYACFFAGTEFEFVREPEGCRSNYWLNAVLLPDRGRRDAFLAYTNDHGVMTRPAWEMMPNLAMYADCQRDALSVSREIVDRLVNIPSGVRLREFAQKDNLQFFHKLPTQALSGQSRV
jgi:aminotransferase in exopolysaccharide biosynthesis